MGKERPVLMNRIPSQLLNDLYIICYHCLEGKVKKSGSYLTTGSSS